METSKEYFGNMLSSSSHQQSFTDRRSPLNKCEKYSYQGDDGSAPTESSPKAVELVLGSVAF